MRRALLLAFVALFIQPMNASAAIAFDNATTSSASLSAGGSLSRSFTVTGTNVTLLAWTVAGGANVTDVQYNGVSMTQLREEALSGSTYELWVLKNPASGANNFTITGTAFLNTGFSLATYTGTDQTAGVVDNQNAGFQGAATTHAQTLTPTKDNSWHIGVACSSSQQAAGSATTRRSTATAMVGGPGTCGIFDSGNITPAAANNLNETSASASVTFQDVTLAPFVDPPVTPQASTLILFGDW